MKVGLLKGDVRIPLVEVVVMCDDTVIMLTITDLNDDARYQAMYTRDKRYDGIFFTAVKTTGIYCRPSCPAPKPLQKNCFYFETAAKARAHGFRACKRCHPDRLEHDASRAILHMIEDGVLNEGSMQSLAKKSWYQ